MPTPEQIIQWEAEISKAEVLRTHRPEEMDIMAPRIEKGQFITFPDWARYRIRGMIGRSDRSD